MSHIDSLRKALLDLEPHLAKAGLALLKAEGMADPAEIRQLLLDLGIRYKSQRDLLTDWGYTALELYGEQYCLLNRVTQQPQKLLAHDLAHQSRPAEVETQI